MKAKKSENYCILDKLFESNTLKQLRKLAIAKKVSSTLCCDAEKVVNESECLRCAYSFSSITISTFVTVNTALNALVLQYQCIFTLGFSFYLFICLYIIIIVITIIGIILVF